MLAQATKCKRYRGICSGNSISFPAAHPQSLLRCPSVTQRVVPVCMCVHVCAILYKNGNNLFHVALYRGKSFSNTKIIHND